MNYKQAVEAALQGNADAFSALYESTQNNMYYLALKYMKNPDDAKDVLQDAYIKAWQSLPTLKDPGTFSGMAWKNRGKYRQKYACKEKTGPVFGPGKGK